MSLEFVNRICPSCKNPNYMVSLGNFSNAYKYKCMNCNRYFNDIDFGEPLQPVWLTECMNKKADMVEVVRCRDCKWRENNGATSTKWLPCMEVKTANNWFCADGKRRDDND